MSHAPTTIVGPHEVRRASDSGEFEAVRIVDLCNLSSSANSILKHRVLAMRARGMDNRIICTPGDFDRLKSISPQIGGFIKAISTYYLDFYASVGLKEGCHLHDPAAIIAAAHSQHFNTIEVPLSVVLDGDRKGETVPMPDSNGNKVQVCMDVDDAGVKARFMRAFSQLP